MLYVLGLGLVAAEARIPVILLLRRLGWEAPFLFFALALPLLGRTPDVQVLGIDLSREGLWASWNVVAKATLGFSITLVLGATTRPSDLLRALERLRAPRVLTAIAGFMVRYADVLTTDVRRMRIAREARGYDPRWLWQARAVASTAGTLFIRTYERGERVYNAMLARGFDGRMSPLQAPAAPAADWLVSMISVALVAAVAVASSLFR